MSRDATNTEGQFVKRQLGETLPERNLKFRQEELSEIFRWFIYSVDKTPQFQDHYTYYNYEDDRLIP